MPFIRINCAQDSRTPKQKSQLHRCSSTRSCAKRSIRSLRQEKRVRIAFQ
jgi:hypothetical protein